MIARHGIIAKKTKTMVYMEIIPAIDLLGGKVVRLSKGKAESAKIYSGAPIQMLRKFAYMGAKTIHIVDLDAAFGSGNNAKLIGQLAQAALKEGVALQVGGGIRSMEKAGELADAGVGRMVIGTAAADPVLLSKFVLKFGKRIWVGIDAMDGIAMTNGWKESSNVRWIEALQNAQKAKAGGVVLTDISKDGMLGGISEEFYSGALKAATLPICASGGIASLQDIRKLARIGVNSAILGKAYYEGRVELGQAIRAAGGKPQAQDEADRD